MWAVSKLTVGLLAPQTKTHKAKDKQAWLQGLVWTGRSPWKSYLHPHKPAHPAVDRGNGNPHLFVNARTCSGTHSLLCLVCLFGSENGLGQSLEVAPLLTPGEEWIWRGKLDSGPLVWWSAPLGSLCVLPICLPDFIFCSSCHDAGELMRAEHLYCAPGKQEVKSWPAPYHTLEFNLSAIKTNIAVPIWLLYLLFIVFWLLEGRVIQNLNKIVGKSNVCDFFFFSGHFCGKWENIDIINTTVGSD